MIRIYGNENTHLTLSKKAQEIYSGNEDIIQEIEIDDGYRYIVRTRGFPVGTKPMTEKELNEWYESGDDYGN